MFCSTGGASSSCNACGKPSTVNEMEPKAKVRKSAEWMMSLSVLEEVAISVRKPMDAEPKPAVSDMPIN